MNPFALPFVPSKSSNVPDEHEPTNVPDLPPDVLESIIILHVADEVIDKIIGGKGVLRLLQHILAVIRGLRIRHQVASVIASSYEKLFDFSYNENMKWANSARMSGLFRTAESESFYELCQILLDSGHVDEKEKEKSKYVRMSSLNRLGHETNWRSDPSCAADILLIAYTESFDDVVHAIVKRQPDVLFQQKIYSIDLHTSSTSNDCPNWKMSHFLLDRVFDRLLKESSHALDSAVLMSVLRLKVTLESHANLEQFLNMNMMTRDELKELKSFTHRGSTCTRLLDDAISRIS